MQFILCLGKTTDEILIDYLKAKSPVHSDVEWRIRYLIKTSNGTILSSDPGAPPGLDSADSPASLNANGASKASNYKALGLIMSLPLIANSMWWPDSC